MSPPTPPSELAHAAEALEAELRRFEALTGSLLETPLSSEKHLERAARTLQEVAASDQQLVTRVRALVEALGRARERQQSLAEKVNARGQDIERRAGAFQALMRRYGALGTDAASLNAEVQALAARRAGGDEAGAAQALADSLTPLQERMGSLASEAQGVGAEAAANDFHDVARQAEGLRQQLLAARNRLALLQRTLSGGSGGAQA